MANPVLRWFYFMKKSSKPGIEGATGQYLVKCKPARSKPITHDLQVAERLSTLSISLTGLRDETDTVTRKATKTVGELSKQVL